jgi:hypothetical protein
LNLWYFISFDKHTSFGKEILDIAAAESGLFPFRARTLGFFMEGSVCNAISDSPYWELHKQWEIQRIGLSAEQAEQKWAELKNL